MAIDMYAMCMTHGCELSGQQEAANTTLEFGYNCMKWEEELSTCRVN